MVSPVNLIAAVPQSGVGTATNGSPNLAAQMNNMLSQLETQVTGNSSGTPQGKARIKEIEGKLDDIRSQIERASTAAAKAEAKKAETSPTPAVAAAVAAKTVTRMEAAAAASRESNGKPVTSIDVYA